MRSRSTTLGWDGDVLLYPPQCGELNQSKVTRYCNKYHRTQTSKALNDRNVWHWQRWELSSFVIYHATYHTAIQCGLHSEWRLIGDASTEFTIRDFGLGQYWYRLHGNLADRSLSDSSNTYQRKFQQPVTWRCAESLKKKRGIQFQ